MRIIDGKICAQVVKDKIAKDANPFITTTIVSEVKMRPRNIHNYLVKQTIIVVSLFIHIM